MYFRFSTLLPVAALAAVAVAAPSELKARNGGSSECNTGPIQCCNQLFQPNDPGLSELLGLLGIVLGDVTALVGVNCSPISIVGLGSNSCSSQPVCCNGNTDNGLININCNPINIGL